jgi:hypothetical protein
MVRRSIQPGFQDVRAENYDHVDQAVCQYSWRATAADGPVVRLHRFATQLRVIREHVLRSRGAAWGANWEQTYAPNRGTAFNGSERNRADLRKLYFSRSAHYACPGRKRCHRL